MILRIRLSCSSNKSVSANIVLAKLRWDIMERSSCNSSLRFSNSNLRCSYAFSKNLVRYSSYSNLHVPYRARINSSWIRPAYLYVIIFQTYIFSSEEESPGLKAGQLSSNKLAFLYFSLPIICNCASLIKMT